MRFSVVGDEYFNAAGSTIEFSNYERRGRLFLRQHGVALDPTNLWTVQHAIGQDKRTWYAQHCNLQAGLGADIQCPY
jgi:hypothetical protein